MKNRIKDLRQDKDLNQEQLATYLNISRSSYRDIENNITILTVETIEKLVVFYSTSFEYLLNLTKKQHLLDKKIYNKIIVKYNINFSSLIIGKPRCLPKDKHL